MKPILALVFVTLLTVPFPPRADASRTDAIRADAIVGLWATDKGKAHVQIRWSESGYEGQIVWLKDPVYPPDDPEAGEARHDRENPDPRLRDRPIEGLRILSGFRYAGEGEWEDGRIYDPETGNTYDAVMWLTDSGTLKVRGYVGFSLLGRTTEWVPVVGAGGRSR